MAITDKELQFVMGRDHGAFSLHIPLTLAALDAADRRADRAPRPPALAARVLVFYKGVPFRATVRKHRRKDGGGHECLVHYDGNKKTTVSWVGVDLIRETAGVDEDRAAAKSGEHTLPARKKKRKISEDMAAKAGRARSNKGRQTDISSPTIPTSYPPREKSVEISPGKKRVRGGATAVIPDKHAVATAASRGDRRVTSADSASKNGSSSDSSSNSSSKTRQDDTEATSEGARNSDWAAARARRKRKGPTFFVARPSQQGIGTDDGDAAFLCLQGTRG